MMTQTYVEEGLEYTASNKRMKFNPEFHENHKKPWTTSELAYLCQSWGAMKKKDIAMALGRTHGTVLSKAYELRKNGTFDFYKNLGDKKMPTALERIASISSQLPLPVLQDINFRIGDWLASGGGEDDPYIHQQLRFAKRFVKEDDTVE